MKQTMYETIINCIFVFMKRMVIPVNTALAAEVSASSKTAAGVVASVGQVGLHMRLHFC